MLGPHLVTCTTGRRRPPTGARALAFERKKAIIARSLYGVEVKRWAVDQPPSPVAHPVRGYAR
ncbi:MAG: hypothetical protein Q9O62_06625 [Ardenticatenia bacterium]|nr:hypothetical protein [Ardenticatenia bacterium]